ncbi:protein kinase domain-containing protein [Dietzia cinnamea]|uniref:protein kinase domain-containing protein n=1 Tax=Dietzia cinnamea TaxID=321318 RepID=UPI0021A47993|nr:NERD domain-containing protein [Dietzia cinnamea]MCT2119511.1 NERD domain-containing protein [Dietzia cinnamea]MCT2143853.1 NERD domain-containing protein [Dietzia cinnamea]MCT2302981.1 NERD domain-containing protein [Dietzia cinnamea]
MLQNSDRWNEVSRSAFEHEKQGLALLANAVPDSAPYRVWANFEFQDSHGQWHEVDALVVGQSRIHLLELKSYHGRLGGDEHRWVTDRGGRVDTMRSPMVATRRKAQRFKSRLEQEINRMARDPDGDQDIRDVAAKVGRLPWIQEAVFLHDPGVVSHLAADKAHNIFGVDPADFPDREVRTNLPPIADRVQEPVGRERISEALSMLIALAMRKIAGITVRDHMAGSYLLHDRVDSPDPRFHEWDGEHRETHEPIRARVLNVAAAATEGEQIRMRRTLRREYELLSGLGNEHIVAPRSMETLRGTSDEVVIYPALPDHRPLDVALPGAKLSSRERVEIVRQVADALLYAHRHQVAHRGLDPTTVLLDTRLLSTRAVDAYGRIEVKVDGWSGAGTSEASGTVLGATGSATSMPGDELAGRVYLAPEAAGVHTPDRMAADLFSLGALAYYVLTGGQAPATDRSSLLDRLERDRGLDMSAVTSEFDQGLRALVMDATAATVGTRNSKFGVSDSTQGLSPVIGFERRLAEAARPATPQPAAEQMDALRPMIDGVLEARFVVKKVLGSGSTAVGLQVEDLTDDSGPPTKVLKVARDERAAERLAAEAEVLRSLGQGLPAKYSSLFVALLEGPMVVHDRRTCLVLTDCGEVSLASMLQLGRISQDRFWKFAINLADMLVALEAAGVAHRDIKPANLGIVGRGRGQHLALFDFSASRESLQHTQVGTGVYRDPFLGRRSRQIADSSAERYSAGVVLFEMATGETPRYGDGVSEPSLTDGHVVIPPEAMPPEWSQDVVEQMTGIFTRLLDGDSGARFGSAQEFREALAAVAASVTAGDGGTTTREPVTPRDAPTPVTAVALPTLAELAEELLRAAGGSRTSDYRLVRTILGRGEGAPEDPFQAMSRYAEPLRLSAGRIPQLTGKFPALWQSSPVLTAAFEEIRAATRREIVRRGGVASIRQIAGAMEQSFPAEQGHRDSERLRLGVLRMFDLGLHRADAAGGSEVELLRRGRSARVIGMSVHPEWARPLVAELNRAAHDLLAEPGVRHVPAELVHSEVRGAARSVLSDAADAESRIDPLTLAELAVAGDDELALTATGDLYSTAMELPELLALTLPRAASQFDLGLLKDLIRARFPELRTREPRREDVEAVLAEHMPGMGWDPQHRDFRYPQQATGLSMVHTRTPSALVTDRSATEDPLIEQLARAASSPGFVSVSVPYGRGDEVAGKLAERLGAEVVDLSAEVLASVDSLLETSGQLDKRGDFLRLPPEQVRGVMEANVTTVLDNVDATDGAALVLTEASLLAEYSQLSQLGRWTDLTAPPCRPVVLVTGRAKDAPGQPDQVDGRPLPITSDSQLVSV